MTGYVGPGVHPCLSPDKPRDVINVSTVVVPPPFPQRETFRFDVVSRPGDLVLVPRVKLAVMRPKTRPFFHPQMVVV